MTAVLAQAVPGSTSPAPDLDKIRKALAETSAITIAPPAQPDGPVFRVTVHGDRLKGTPWDGWSAAPTYVRPWFRADHHEFLEQVLKDRVRAEEFRGPTLYPIGIDVVRVGQFLARQITAANRRRQGANAKEEVQRALEEFVACQANRARPGC
jgi:hypothetical protein